MGHTNDRDRETPAQQRAHLQEMLEKLESVMFLSFASTGEAPDLDARPLHISKLDGDAAMWFVVSKESSQARQVKQNAQVVVTAQDPKHWLWLKGTARVVTDRGKVKSIFNKMHEAWFPNGPEDPDVVLISFRPETAEYWDNSGVRGFRYLFEVARALLTDSAAQPTLGVHGKVP